MRITTDNVWTSASARNEHQQKVLDSVAVWAGYYRSNIHRFVMDYLHVSLKLFQIFLIYMMNICYTFVFIGFRGIGKSFISACFICARCILYPGTKVVIASGTRGQAINVLEKIMVELKPNSPELAKEIDEKETSINNTTAVIHFKNGSTVKVVTASDSARSNRANILIIDEFRMVRKDTIDTILRKFLTGPRHPKFMDRPEYRGKKEYQEHNMTHYLSSAYYQDHWSFTRCKDSCRMMLDETKHSFVCGFPYQLGIVEDILMEDEIAEQMLESDFNEISWYMEMCAMFFGNVNGSFFGFDSISKNRRIDLPVLPNELSAKLPGSTKIRIQPKGPGEIRIISVDVALMATTKHNNDATAIFVNYLHPTKGGRYSSNIVYTEVMEGAHTEDQALRIRKLFDEYDCDYLVLDTRNAGLSIFDAMARDITDPQSGNVYPAISCCNNQAIADRCVDRDAPKVVWAILGNPRLNSDCAILLRDGFRSDRIRLLQNEYDGQEEMESIPGWGRLNPSERTALMLPYVNTTLLINEMINLQYEENDGMVKLSEKGTARKDRYSSLSYNYYVVIQLEKELRKRIVNDMDSDRQTFIFRAPKQSWSERR